MDKDETTVNHLEASTGNAGNAGATVVTSEKVAVYEQTQHEQTKIQAIKENWKGIGWCKCSCTHNHPDKTNEVSL